MTILFSIDAVVSLNRMMEAIYLEHGGMHVIIWKKPSQKSNK